MTLPDFLTRDAYGYCHITGHRIGLVDMVYFFNQGESPEMLHCRFPTVSVAMFYKVIAFYLENQKEVDAECADHEAWSTEQRKAPPSGPSLEELRRRWEARRLSQGA